LGKKTSYYYGLPNEPLIALTIGQVLDDAVVKYPEYETLASVHQGLRYTYREFHDICTQVAKGLMGLGIARGENTAIWATSLAEWMIAQFATAKIGATLVTINPAYRVYELEYALRLSESKALLLTDSYKTSDYISMFYQLCPEAKYAKEKGITS